VNPNPEEVRLVQRLLNSLRQPPLRLIAQDGIVGTETIGAIEEFQRNVLRMVSPTGRVDPGSQTWSELSGVGRTTPIETGSESAEDAIQQMESAAVNFATRTINDARVREGYVADARKYATELFQDLRAKRITKAQAAERANLIRNQLLDASRLKSSDVGTAVAERLKQTGKTLGQLQEHYAAKMFQKTFTDLTAVEQNRVYLKIVGSSARPNQAVTRGARVLGKAGRGLIVVALAVSVYNVATAEDPGREAAHEVVGIGAGFAGSVAGGAAAGLLCGPGAPACVAIGAFVGGVLFALGADYSFDKLVE
jgi:hypothetical protein